MSRGGGFRGRGGPPGLPAFNQRDYMEAMQKAHKHGGMLYPVSRRGQWDKLRITTDM
jgi:hypothetical protein